MSTLFSERLERLPRYEAGMAADDARRAFGRSDVVKLASNESPDPPSRAVLDAIRDAAAGINRYPAQGGAPLREAIASRLGVDAGRVAVGNGSCDVLLAAATALCEPGDEIVYAWPAFSIYPHLAALTGAGERRIDLDERWRHDLEAILGAITAATQLVLLNNPNNPTATYLDAGAIDAFLAEVPRRVTVILDEAYIEFQTIDDVGRSIELVERHPNLCVLRTFSKCYALAGLRVGYSVGSPDLRAAIDAVRQPFTVNSLAQAAAIEALSRPEEVAGRVARTLAERERVEAEISAMGLSHSDSQANFSWIALPDGTSDADAFRGLAERGVIVRAGAPLGAPGHLRVTYGTREQNDLFLSALADLLGLRRAAG